jgi:hypothetical protein
MEYALLINSELQETRNYDERPENIPHKNVEWYPVKREEGEDFQGVEDDFYVFRTTPAVVIPEGVTPRQARLALNAIDKLDEVNAAVAQADKSFQIAWEFSNEVKRYDPGVLAIAEIVNLSSQQLDELFLAAKDL